MSFDFSGPWLTNAAAAAYVGCKSVAAFYEWKRRHHIVSRVRLVAKADLDRALKMKKIRRLSPVSVANLRRRHAAHSTDSSRSTVHPFLRQVIR